MGYFYKTINFNFLCLNYDGNEKCIVVSVTFFSEISALELFLKCKKPSWWNIYERPHPVCSGSQLWLQHMVYKLEQVCENRWPQPHQGRTALYHGKQQDELPPLALRAAYWFDRRTQKMLTEENACDHPEHEHVHLPRSHVWKVESTQCHWPWWVTASESTYWMPVVLHSIALK